ncbi:MAG: NAD(P)-dependent oxidoreductase [Tropicimonas sp.]|uniref:NAD(P)-dependent oxidoreductase n=1 Tax=Tropicimonas sp. TaxID=2067044 RepID=UPI003A8577E5
MTDVALIGFGVMGRAAGRLLVEAGHGLSVCDPAPGTREAAAGIGAGFAATLAEAAQAEVVLLFLPGPDQIRHVVSGQGGLFASAQHPLVIVDHSTADPGVAREMAELGAANGHGWLDAPVLGRPGAVGKWALPVGQTEGALDAARPVLECYAGHIFEAGGPGAGHTIKLLNQMMFGAINAMTAEMMATSEALGVAPGRLYEIITTSQAGTVSNLFRELGARIAEDRYSEPTFSVKLLEKDVRLGLEMARAAGRDPRLGAVVAAYNEEAIAAGRGEEDSSVMWKVLANAG